MRCSDCGFPLDPLNSSQLVCPACGAAPGSDDLGDFDELELDTLNERDDLEEEPEDDAQEARGRAVLLTGGLPATRWVN